MQEHGKSTLVKFIISALEQQYDIDPEKDVVYTSFTGKATQVLQKKGNKNVSTLHKLLFESIPNPDGTFFRRPVTSIDYKIVVVDECSMVPKELLEALFKHNCYILCLGDPGQLPPINKDDDNMLLQNPDIFLDEIMRQDEDSEIIDLTMKIRNGEPLQRYEGKEIQILNKNELTAGMLLWADQIICATNTMRTSLNNQMRELTGHKGEPQDGDKIICLKNNWEIFSDGDNPLVNGTIGYLKNPFSTNLHLPPFITSTHRAETIPVTMGEFVSDTEENYGNLVMDKKLIVEGEAGLDWRTSYNMSRHYKFRGAIPQQFTYGYAITCHKSQGSEWDKVLVIEEGFPFHKEEHKRWLYTAATRAAKKLVIIKKE